MGIFHPHSDLHNIKKENIGLIEVMGLAVLPERLNTQLTEISEYLTDGTREAEEVNCNEHPLFVHYSWIKMLIERHGQKNSVEETKQILQDEVSHVFAKVLRDAGVFKADKEGRQGFESFMKYCGFQKE